MNFNRHAIFHKIRLVVTEDWSFASSYNICFLFFSKISEQCYFLLISKLAGFKDIGLIVVWIKTRSPLAHGSLCCIKRFIDFGLTYKATLDFYCHP